MRYPFAALCLFVVLPNLIAAPVPDPSVVLDIGPPRKGERVEIHRQTETGCLTYARGMLIDAWHEAKLYELRRAA